MHTMTKKAEHAMQRYLCELGAQGGSQVVREGHEGLGLVRGIAEHDALVAGSDVLQLGGINRLGNIGGLLLNRHDHVARAVVQPFVDVVVADVLESLADDLLVVDVGRGRDLAKDHHHAGLGARLCQEN